MKKINLSMLAMAGLLFAACADKEVVEGGGGQNEIPSEGYVSLAINLPTTPSTRAANDDFDDGDPDRNEYKVNSCLLLIFEGTTESDAELINAESVQYSPVNDVDNDNITTSYRVVSKISGYDNSPESTSNLYALAALNYNGVLTYDAETSTVKVGKTDTEVKKLSDLTTNTTNVDLSDIGTTSKGFFMTNAVLSPTSGGAIAPVSSTIQLAKLEKTKIYGTEEAAKKDPAGEVLVERAVAKATLKLASDLEVNLGTGVTISDVSWTLDNLEPLTYIARNKGTDDYLDYKSNAPLERPYRFVSHTSTKNATSLGTAEDFYRTYWCVDPNYSKSLPGGLKRYTDNPIIGSRNYVEAIASNPLYCFENTFDVRHQRYDNTTRAIIKVKVDGGTFYTLNGEYYTETTLEAAIKGYAIERLIDAIGREYLNTNQTFEFNATNIPLDYALGAANESDKSCQVTKLEFKGSNPFANATIFKTGTAELAATVLKETLDYMEANYFIYEYAEGIMYYQARFTHFGDELTPWNTTEWGTDETVKPAAGGVDKAYPGCGENDTPEDKLRAANNYLGRYGMVRNNWYDVEITKFLNFGSPVEPSDEITSDDTPDDNLDEYISVRIHVLAWAKRTQKWGF